MNRTTATATGLAGVAAGLVSGAILATAGISSATTQDPPDLGTDARPILHGVVEHTVLTPCRSEADDLNCYWNARRQGNGRGHSFYVIRVGHQEAVIYWNKRYNRKHGFVADAPR